MIVAPRLRPLVALAVLVVLSAATAATAEGWKAGTARATITPEKPMWMAGYGSRTSPSEGVVHDLWVKALALEDPDGSAAVLVTLDLCGIGADLSNPIRDAIREKHGLDRSRIVLACSHTHTGPVVGRNLIGMYPLDEAQKTLASEYSDRLVASILEVVAEALEARGPAEVSWGNGRCDFAVNRRTNMEPEVPALREKLALQGPVDHDVPVLAVRGEGGSLRAVVFGYACHCTVLSLNRFSGDYAGFAQIAMEAAHDGAQAMFVAGCGADQNPLPRRTIELAEGYGKQLARAVDRVLGGAMTPVEGKLTPSYEEIDLALGEIPDRAHWEAEAKSASLPSANRAKALLRQIEERGEIARTYPYPVQLWRLGDELRWVFLGGEVTVDYSLRLKRNLGSSTTWVSGYCNDVMAYIPSLRVLKEGGYEAETSMIYYGLPAPWSEKVEEQVVEAVRGLAAKR